MTEWPNQSPEVSSCGVKETGIMTEWPNQSPEAEGSAANMMKN